MKKILVLEVRLGYFLSRSRLQRHVLGPVFLCLELEIIFAQVNKQLRVAQSQVSCHVVPTVRLQVVSILTVENIFEIFSQTILVCIGDDILMLDLVRLTRGVVTSRSPAGGGSWLVLFL